MKSLVTFLVEQPNQLKHIEWPSFQSTVSFLGYHPGCFIFVFKSENDSWSFFSILQLKTAIFSLILVGVLIIALASVDSALCYMLSLLLRKRVWLRQRCNSDWISHSRAWLCMCVGRGGGEGKEINITHVGFSSLNVSKVKTKLLQLWAADYRISASYSLQWNPEPQDLSRRPCLV